MAVRVYFWSSMIVQWHAAYPILTKSSRLYFLASSRASGPQFCHATGLFICPRTYENKVQPRRSLIGLPRASCGLTYGLRLSLSLFARRRVLAPSDRSITSMVEKFSIPLLCDFALSIRRFVFELMTKFLCTSFRLKLVDVVTLTV